MQTIKTDELERRVYRSEVVIRSGIDNWSERAGTLFGNSMVIEICYQESTDRVLYTNAALSKDLKELFRKGKLYVSDMQETRDKPFLNGEPRAQANRTVEAVVYPIQDKFRAVLLRRFGSDVVYGFGADVEREDFDKIVRRCQKFNDSMIDYEETTAAVHTTPTYSDVDTVEVMEMMVSLFQAVVPSVDGLLEPEINENISKLERLIERSIRGRI